MRRRQLAPGASRGRFHRQRFGGQGARRRRRLRSACSMRIGDDLVHRPSILVIGGQRRAPGWYDEWVAVQDNPRSAHTVGCRRRRSPVVLQRDHRPAQGRDDLQPQPDRAAARRWGDLGDDSRLRRARGDAAVPHRWQWLGCRRPFFGCPPGDPPRHRLRRAGSPVLDPRRHTRLRRSHGAAVHAARSRCRRGRLLSLWR